MNRLTYSLAAVLLGLASSISAVASPLDAKASPQLASQVIGHQGLESSGGFVKVAYSAAFAPEIPSATLNDASFRNATTAAAPNGLNQLLDALPQNKGFTLLAAVGVIFVIAKRRLSAQQR